MLRDQRTYVNESNERIMKDFEDFWFCKDFERGANEYCPLAQ